MAQILNANSSALRSMTKTSNNLKKNYAPSIMSDVAASFDFENEVISTQVYRRAYYSFVSGQDGGVKEEEFVHTTSSEANRLPK